MVERPGLTREYKSIKQAARGKSGGRPKVEYTDAQLTKIFELHDAGKSLREIADVTGLSKNKVGQIICDDELRAKIDELMPWGDSARIRPTVPKSPLKPAD